MAKNKLNKLIRQYVQEALSTFNKRTSNEQCCNQVIKLNGDGTGTLPDGSVVDVTESGIPGVYALASKIGSSKWAADSEEYAYNIISSNINGEEIYALEGSNGWNYVKPANSSTVYKIPDSWTYNAAYPRNIMIKDSGEVILYDISITSANPVGSNYRNGISGRQYTSYPSEIAITFDYTVITDIYFGANELGANTIKQGTKTVNVPSLPPESIETNVLPSSMAMYGPHHYSVGPTIREGSTIVNLELDPNPVKLYEASTLDGYTTVLGAVGTYTFKGSSNGEEGPFSGSIPGGKISAYRLDVSPGSILVAPYISNGPDIIDFDMTFEVSAAENQYTFYRVSSVLVSDGVTTRSFNYSYGPTAQVNNVYNGTSSPPSISTHLRRSVTVSGSAMLFKGPYPGQADPASKDDDLPTVSSITVAESNGRIAPGVGVALSWSILKTGYDDHAAYTFGAANTKSQGSPRPLFYAFSTVVHGWWSRIGHYRVQSVMSTPSTDIEMECTHKYEPNLKSPTGPGGTYAPVLFADRFISGGLRSFTNAAILSGVRGIEESDKDIIYGPRSGGGAADAVNVILDERWKYYEVGGSFLTNGMSGAPATVLLEIQPAALIRLVYQSDLDLYVSQGFNIPWDDVYLYPVPFMLGQAAYSDASYNFLSSYDITNYNLTQGYITYTRQLTWHNKQAHSSAISVDKNGTRHRVVTGSKGPPSDNLGDRDPFLNFGDTTEVETGISFPTWPPPLTSNGGYGYCSRSPFEVYKTRSNYQTTLTRTATSEILRHYSGGYIFNNSLPFVSTPVLVLNPQYRELIYTNSTNEVDVLADNDRIITPSGNIGTSSGHYISQTSTAEEFKHYIYSGDSSYELNNDISNSLNDTENPKSHSLVFLNNIFMVIKSSVSTSGLYSSYGEPVEYLPLIYYLLFNQYTSIAVGKVIGSSNYYHLYTFEKNRLARITDTYGSSTDKTYEIDVDDTTKLVGIDTINEYIPDTAKLGLPSLQKGQTLYDVATQPIYIIPEVVTTKDDILKYFKLNRALSDDKGSSNLWKQGVEDGTIPYGSSLSDLRYGNYAVTPVIRRDGSILKAYYTDEETLGKS